MTDHNVLTALRPTWTEIDPEHPPKDVTALFKSDHGQLVRGQWYEGCGFQWVCPLPQHTPEQKALIRARSTGASGRFADGQPFTQED